jgi:nicotinamidase-related amidase
MPQPDRLDATHAQLLVVDVQTKLLPHIVADGLIENVTKMIRAAVVLGLPVTISEQYPQGLGPTDDRVRAAGGEAAVVLSKTAFSVVGDTAARSHVSSLMRPQVLLVGIETHVCVQQTTLDLLAMQMRPFVLADAVGSRRPYERDVALDGMRAAGAVVTTVESAIFALVRDAASGVFKRILPIVK